MKQNVLLTVLLVFIMAACNSHINYDKTLVQADSLMTSQPDSALAILEDYPINNLKTQADSAYYALLLTQARDKNHIDQTDDSLIRSAIVFYDKTSDVKMQARSYYYSGSIYRDAQRSGEAITQYLKAESLAKNANDNQLLGLIYSNLAYIYYAQDLNEQADSIYHITEQIAILQKDSLLQAEALSQRGIIQMEKGKAFYPKAEKMMLQALYMAKSINNNKLSRNISSALSILYSRMKSGKKAVEFAKQNLALQEDTASCHDAFCILGDAYYKNQQHDSATFYLYKALPAKNYAIKAGVYRRLSDIAKASGNLEVALELEQNYSIYMDSLRCNRNQQAYSVIGTERNAQIIHQQKEHDASNNSHYRNILLSFAVIVIIAGMLKVSKKKATRLKEEKDRLISVQSTIQQQKAKLEEEKRQKEERIIYLEKELEQQHYDAAQKKNLRNELNAFNHEREMLLTNTQKYSEVETKIKQIIQDYKAHDSSELHMEKEDWLQLIAETDRRWDKITLKLCTRYKLSQDEIHLCCLYLTDLPISHFGHLLGCQRDTIHKRANRIVEKQMGFPHSSTTLQKALKEIN